MELEKMQHIAFEILGEVVKICKKYNIRYYLIGGTLLGAIRHQGFIPWDDDIDIGIPREDYNMFLKIAQKELPSFLTVQTKDNTNNYPFLYTKVIHNNTILIEEYLEHLNYISGVFVDVFPIDGAPDGLLRRKIHYNRIFFYRKLRNIYILNPMKNRNIFKKMIIIILKLMLPKEKFKDKIERKLEDLASKFSFDNSKYVANYFGAWGKKEIMPKEYFGFGKKVNFEGLEFNSVANPVLYLKHVYGNYLELPPVEKRKSHHKFKILKID